MTPTTRTTTNNDNLQALWDYIGACTARGSASQRTKEAYGASINLYLAWCRESGLDPLAAREADIENWRGQLLAAGASASTTSLRLSAVRTLYKALRRAGRCDRNPAEFVKSPRPAAAAVDRVMKKIVFPDQMVVVLGKIDASPRGNRDRVILLALYLLGLRVSEVAGLNWEDWRGGTLTFTAKGQQARELALPAALKASMEALKGPNVRLGPMFSGDGGRLTIRAIQKMVEARLRAAGLGHHTPHGLRHSCATAAAINGSSPFAIQDQLGHASQRTTAIYTRVAGRFLEAPSLAIARAMGI